MADKTVTCGCTWDEIPRATTLEFIADSHLHGKWYRPERYNKTPLFENCEQEPPPDIEANRGNYNILGWEMDPGDAVAFHFLTLHGAPGNNSSSTRRRAFSSRWVGDDATFAIRNGKTSPPFPDCRLQHGDPLAHPEFSLILS